MVADSAGARLTLLLSSIAMLWPAAAPAQDEPGVVVDPDSPAGKEYAIPLDQARRESGATVPGGGGGGGGSDGGTTSGALFGAGIAAKAASSAGPSGKSGKAAAEREPNPKANRPAGGSADAGNSDDPAPLLLIGGGAALVLLVGTAVALGLRRLGDDGESLPS
jgi:hypothetical protein